MKTTGPMNLAGKRVVVMGLGRFGGGAGVARFCASLGANVLVTDTTPSEKLAAGLSLIAGLDVQLRLGEHRIEDFTHADCIVVNPAVKPDDAYVAAARNAGVMLTSEIRLLVAHLPSRAHTIAITGSSGKSTTTAMTGHALAKAIGPDRVHVGGNLGGSLLDRLDRIHNDHWVVLELSSFMLHGLRDDHWAPHIAAITNIAPNHLDWHTTYQHYRDTKQAILDHQRPGDIAILTPQSRPHFSPVVKNIRVTRPPEFWPGDLLLPGRHNQTNALVAAAIVQAAVGQSLEKTAHALADFPGLPHRLQFVCEHRSVRFYNDSKATTPEATTLAIDSFPPGRVHVILGGHDKGADLAPMARHAATRCAAIYTIGTTGPAIAQAASAVSPSESLTPSRPCAVHHCSTLQHAIPQIISNLKQDDIVLLSTGCASLDQFENYEQRGAAFAQLILAHTGENTPIPPAA